MTATSISKMDGVFFSHNPAILMFSGCNSEFRIPLILIRPNIPEGWPADFTILLIEFLQVVRSLRSHQVWVGYLDEADQAPGGVWGQQVVVTRPFAHTLLDVTCVNSWKSPYKEQSSFK